MKRLISVFLLGAVLVSAGASVVMADHDMVTDDLIYFLPMPAARAKRLLDTGENMLFIDIRPVQEFKQKHLPGARSIPLKEMDKSFNKIPRDGRVVLYCACPPGKVEEGYAYQLLRDQGYRNVTVLEGGFTEWVKRGFPVEAGGSP